MTNPPEKLPMHTPDFTKENIAQLAVLFPHCVTESHDENKQPKRVIDFDMLRAELSGEMIEGPDERYHLNWPGKRAALLAMRAPVAKTLRPKREDSEGFDKTQNLFIEGDNLDALRLLQKSYLGKVKMIYIDPPYNTGNDFIYNDDFKEKTGEYLLESEQTDEDGNRLETNTESNGRFHSDWLSMMYPRLKLARNLLRDDGVIFISIDDNEQANLKKLCDEIFGVENFVGNIIWEKRYGRSNNAKLMTTSTEHILLFRKSSALNLLRETRSENHQDGYSNPDNDPRGVWTSVSFVNQVNRESRPNLTYTITNPNTGEKIDHPTNAWKVSKEKYEIFLEENRLHWGADGKAKYPRIKRFLSELDDGMVPVNFWKFKDVGTVDMGTKEIKELMDSGIFTFPKPTLLIKKMLSLFNPEELENQEDDIILDFFAGSGTTADAVMQMNAKDGGNRRFICVQLPEVCGEKSEAAKAEYKNIAEIAKERIRRAGKKILADSPHADWNKDIGFRTFAIDSSNMRDVYYHPQDITQEKMPAMVKNIKDDRSPEDLLFQVMADWGMDLSLRFKTEQIEGAGIFFVDGKTLVACLDGDNATISIDFCKDLALRKPKRVIFLDASFSSSSVKASVAGIFKTLSPNTDLKVL